MKWRSLRYDPDVKPFWRNVMRVTWYGFMILVIPRVILREYNKHNNFKYEELENILTWIALPLALAMIMLGILNWLVPKLFRMQKQ